MQFLRDFRQKSLGENLGGCPFCYIVVRLCKIRIYIRSHFLFSLYQRFREMAIYLKMLNILENNRHGFF